MTDAQQVTNTCTCCDVRSEVALTPQLQLLITEGMEESGAHEDVQRPGRRSWVSGGILLGCWAVFVAFQLLLSHYPRCSWNYWTIFSVQTVLSLVAECIFVRLVTVPPTP